MALRPPTELLEYSLPGIRGAFDRVLCGRLPEGVGSKYDMVSSSTELLDEMGAPVVAVQFVEPVIADEAVC